MAFKNIEDARAYDRARSKDPVRKEQQRISSRKRWKENPEARRKQKAATQKWQEENKEHWNEYRNDWMKSARDSNMESSRAQELHREMKKYGTTVEGYRDNLIKQLGLCALCFHLNRTQGTIQRLTVDHDHKCCDLKTKSCGKCLRGLLCSKCNLRLAYLEAVLKESTIVPKEGTWTARAITYLKHYELLLWPVADDAMAYLRLALAQPGASIRLTNIQAPSYL